MSESVKLSNDERKLRICVKKEDWLTLKGTILKIVLKMEGVRDSIDVTQVLTLTAIISYVHILEETPVQMIDVRQQKALCH